MSDSSTPAGLVRLPVLVLDFDGTICLGDGPIWAYADGIVPNLLPDDARRLTDGLAQYLAGQAPPGRYADGYSAVVRLAGPAVPPTVLDGAYHASREALAAGKVQVHAPDGLADFLTELAGSASRVLLTNSPDIGLDLLLERLGLASVIDKVIPSAGKPEGFGSVLPTLLDGAPPAHLMSVGDYWLNDIAAPLAAGCATAFVDISGADPRPAHAKAASLPELYPAIRSWAVDPDHFTATRAPAASDGRSAVPLEGDPAAAPPIDHRPVVGTAAAPLECGLAAVGNGLPAPLARRAAQRLAAIGLRVTAPTDPIAE